MHIETLLTRTDWLPCDVKHGYGCGYIGLPKEHPWYGKDYDELAHVTVHGGLTWAANYTGARPVDGLWWIGFDTNHWEDNAENCDEAYCLEQLEWLKKQALEASAVAVEKKETYLVYDENNSVCEVAETEAEAVAIAEEALAGLEKFAQQRGEWPYFDQIYVAKVTHVLREDQVNDDNLQVRLVKV